MEIIIGVSRQKAIDLKKARLARGAIDVSASALITAYNHAVGEKNSAIDAQDFENAAQWRDNEKNILHGIADLGLAPPDSDAPRTLLTVKR